MNHYNFPISNKVFATGLSCAFLMFFLTFQINAQQVAASFVMPDDAPVYQNQLINYYRYLPLDYTVSGEKYPLIIFLHGRGEARKVDGRTNPISALLKSGTPPSILEYQDPKALGKFVVISPQSPQTKWYPEFINEVLNHALETYHNIDPNRVYVTGLSSGGAGTWNFALNYSNRVAAIVPIASPGVVDTTCSPDSFGIWAFYGENDVKTEKSWVRAYNSCNHPVDGNITMIPGGEHNSKLWGTVYKNSPTSLENGESTGLTEDTIYNWMLAHSKDAEIPVLPIYPKVNAGEDVSIVSPSDTIRLNGKASDPDGSIASVLWTQIEGPEAAVITDPKSPVTSIYGVSEGKYIFRLTCTDNEKNSSSDDIQISIKAGGMAHTEFLYRVNCGGLDEGEPDSTWLEDKHKTPCAYISSDGYSLTTGSNFWNGTNSTDAPDNVFGNYRYGKTTKPMIYSFPVQPGLHQVNLYFVDDRNPAGSNIFNVIAEETTLLNNFDIAGEFGIHPGKKSFQIDVTDGSLDLHFIALQGYSRIDGIEVKKVSEESLSKLSFSEEFEMSYTYMPERKSIDVSYTKPEKDEVFVELYDINGVLRTSLVTDDCDSAGKCHLSSDLSQLPGGIYILIFKSHSRVWSEKMMIY